MESVSDYCVDSPIFLPPKNWKMVRILLPFGRVRPEKFSFSVKAYPPLGGSIISANLWYIFLASCNVDSGKPLEGEASWERDGVDIDKYMFSESDVEACTIMQIVSAENTNTRLFYVLFGTRYMTNFHVLYICSKLLHRRCFKMRLPVHDIELIQTQRRCDQLALVFQHCKYRNIDAFFYWG